MSNTIITPQLVAQEALLALDSNLVMGNLVHRNYSNEFAAKGDTVTVRKPANFTATEHNGTTSTISSITEGSVDVKLDTLLYVDINVSTKEMTSKIQNLSNQVITPAMRAHAQAIDTKLTGLYKNIPYNSAVGGTPGVADIAALGKIMNINKVPTSERTLVLDPVTHAKYITLDAFMLAQNRGGNTGAIADANIGRVLGFDSYMDQNIASHTSGAGTVKIDLVAGYSAGATEIHVDGVTTALVVGDLITIATKQYTVTAVSALATADQDITIYPALKADVANDADVTVVASHVANMAFHKNAFCLVTRPIAAPLGARSEQINYNGLSVTVVYSYDNATKSDIVSIQTLVGVKTLCPELAVRFTG